MNDIEKYFHDNPGYLITKWDSYFEAYDKHFSRFRGKEVVILEIGVFHGGSLKMWKHYFGEKATIIGVDINPECKKFEEEGIKVYIGSQEDREFLKYLKKEVPKIDVLIDDGGHTMTQQITTFEEMYGHLSTEGVYLCEDVHTSYFEEFGGGYRKESTFIEYTKKLIDQLNAWHSKNKEEFDVEEITLTTKSMHFYESIVVLERGDVKRPEYQATGKQGMKYKNEMTFFDKLRLVFKQFLYKYIKR